ncbi:uncharacterized protein EV422DRAFT_492747 [Fimicolochytrium jonesii]|uniref:uncharacterized protein n=1 Tax=Fimicolochytrium jonesii TaxID=1396493 RepID=UPI0022FE9B26|nr:uncharacterized protein EV422DRAFT_492747 [Fimicolochytrium jonesii]KAI8825308.1 hypothetical protein EV422DRAFT_492747 [Fimicolochytrium jonesii]
MGRLDVNAPVPSNPYASRPNESYSTNKRYEDQAVSYEGQQQYGNKYGQHSQQHVSAPSAIPASLFKAPLEFVGPLLRFHDIDQERRQWSGSVLIVCRKRPEETPVLMYGDGKSDPRKAPMRELFTINGNVFYRFDLVVPLGSGGDKAVTYIINSGSPYVFYVPAAGANARAMGMSCNGFSSDVTNPEEAGGIAPLWKDVLRRHKEQPFHVMLGGGDQLYMDPIFTSNDEILAWLKIEGREAKKTAPFHPAIQHSVENFYFNQYMKCFSEDHMKEAFATIPYIFQWDDHDIFDGWGSYNDWLAECPTFQGIYTTARHYYLLFQQHTTDANRRNDEPHVFGVNGSYSFVKQLGPSLAVLGVDTRSERTLNTIASQKSWDQAFAALQKVATPRLKHLIVMAAIPVVWPRLSTADTAVEGLGNFLAFASDKINVFGEFASPGSAIAGIGEAPELADDLCDHWTNDNHAEERKQMVLRLQQYAREHSVRVTFLSGDVHCCGIGWFRSKQQAADPSTDPNVMWQIISSAIVNIPPPPVVIKMLHNNAGPYDLTDTVVDEMIPIFAEDVNGTPLGDSQNKILPRRNYSTFYVDQREDLQFALHVEREDRTADAKEYPVKVVALRSRGY